MREAGGSGQGSEGVWEARLGRPKNGSGESFECCLFKLQIVYFDKAREDFRISVEANEENHR